MITRSQLKHHLNRMPIYAAVTIIVGVGLWGILFLLYLIYMHAPLWARIITTIVILVLACPSIGDLIPDEKEPKDEEPTNIIHL